MQCVTAVEPEWLAELGPMFFSIKVGFEGGGGFAFFGAAWYRLRITSSLRLAESSRRKLLHTLYQRGLRDLHANARYPCLAGVSLLTAGEAKLGGCVSLHHDGRYIVETPTCCFAKALSLNSVSVHDRLPLVVACRTLYDRRSLTPHG
jgi:hypothetical protein